MRPQFFCQIGWTYNIREGLFYTVPTGAGVCTCFRRVETSVWQLERPRVGGQAPWWLRYSSAGDMYKLRRWGYPYIELHRGGAGGDLFKIRSICSWSSSSCCSSQGCCSQSGDVWRCLLPGDSVLAKPGTLTQGSGRGNRKQRGIYCI